MSRGCSLFSMATPTSTNDFLLFKESNGAMQLPVRYVGSAFTGLPGKQNIWMGHCHRTQSCLDKWEAKCKEAGIHCGECGKWKTHHNPRSGAGCLLWNFQKKGRHYFPKVMFSNEFNTNDFKASPQSF